MTMKVVIIGLGQAGCTLARRALAIPHVRVIGVDTCAQARDLFTQRLGIPAGIEMEEVIAEHQPDVAVIATPNDQHAAHIRRLIHAGVRNLFCEKPLATRLEDARAVVALSERHGIRTSLGFQGCHPGLRRIRDRVAAGELGRVLSVHLHSFRGYGFWGRERVNHSGRRGHHAAVKHPERSGGWTVHHACHSVFTLMSLAGDPVSVYGVLGRSDPACPSEELVQATLRFAHGAVGQLLDSVGSHRGLHCVVIGDQGTLVLSDEHRKNHGDPIVLRSRREGEDHDRIEPLAYNEAAPDRLEEFLHAVQHDRPSPITFAQGLRNLEVCLAIAQSSRTAAAIDLTPSDAGLPICPHPVHPVSENLPITIPPLSGPDAVQRRPSALIAPPV